MRDDPALNTDIIAACLNEEYGIRVFSITWLPVGYDLGAVVYKVVADNDLAWFVKIRSGEIHAPGLHLSRALIDLGIRNIVAPLQTRSSQLWCPLAGYPGHTMVVFPFVQGENAMISGMTDDQWREFGSTLRAIHESGIGQRFRGRLQSEAFALPSAALVRKVSRFVNQESPASQIAVQFAGFWREHESRINDILIRAETLGESLQAKYFDLVPCHADIHAANILVGDDDRIWLVDWDAPLLAPRERDLLFIIGSRIARPVEVAEEARFFEGYGSVDINTDALIYYRYERIIQDLGEFGQSILMDEDVSEHMREDEARLAMDFFAPDGDIDRAKTIVQASPAIQLR